VKFVDRRKEAISIVPPLRGSGILEDTLPRVPASSAAADSASTLGYYLVAPTALAICCLLRFHSWKLEAGNWKLVTEN
jgi:hypothetical protein